MTGELRPLRERRTAEPTTGKTAPGVGHDVAVGDGLVRFSERDFFHTRTSDDGHRPQRPHPFGESHLVPFNLEDNFLTPDETSTALTMSPTRSVASSTSRTLWCPRDEAEGGGSSIQTSSATQQSIIRKYAIAIIANLTKTRLGVQNMVVTYHDFISNPLIGLFPDAMHRENPVYCWERSIFFAMFYNSLGSLWRDT